MKIQYDLRPAEMMEKERKQKSFNGVLLLAILLIMAFFGSSGVYIGHMSIELFSLKDKVMERTIMVTSLETEKRNLERQVNDLKAREKVFADTLKIMQDDLPTLEVLNALETNMDDYGIGFDSLRFVVGRTTRGVKDPDSLEVTGLVLSDKQVIDFSERLGASGVFNGVSLSNTTRNEQTGMISFTLRMPTKSIGQIEAR